MGGRGDCDVTARALLDALSLSPASARRAEAPVQTWESKEGYAPQGTPGFNEFARAQMRLASVPSNPSVRPPSELNQTST